MRKLGLGAWSVLALSAAACAGMAACSAEPGVEEDFEDPGVEAGTGEDATVDVSVARDARPDRKETGGETDAGAADAKKDGDASVRDGDASTSDAPKDSFAETGSPCSPLNAIQTRQCGYCGQQYRVCLDPEDSGATTWQEWGVCLNEVDGGCMPGDTIDASCGRCGTMVLTCNKTCSWPTTGTCKDQGPCWPGDQDFVLGLSCTDSQYGRQRECNSECEWDPFGSCEMPPTGGFQISTEVGGRVGRRLTLKVTPSVGYSSFYPYEGTSCSSSYWYTYSNYSYAFFEVSNPTDSDAKVSVWTYPATGSSALSNPYYVGIRALSSPPTNYENGLDGGYNGYDLSSCSPDWVSGCCTDTKTDPSACPTASSCFTYTTPYWGGLMDGESKAVIIPAHSSVWFFVQNLYEYPSTGGDIMIGMKTHAFY